LEAKPYLQALNNKLTASTTNRMIKKLMEKMSKKEKKETFLTSDNVIEMENTYGAHK
jgi:hypothetical protein